MNINYFLKILVRRLWILVIVPLIALIAVLYFTRDYQREYLSTAQLATGFTVSDQVKVTEDKSSSVQEAEVKFNNVIQNITSLKVASLMAYSLVLHDLNSPLPYRKPDEKNMASKVYQTVLSDKAGYEKILKNHLDSSQVLSSYNPKERLLLELLRLYSYDYEALLKSQVFAARVENTDYIYVTARTENPELSAAMVNTLCTVFLKFNSLQRLERFDESIQTFKTLAEQKKQEFDKKSNLLKGFKSSQGILNIDNESKSKNDLMKDYESSLSDAENNSYSAKLELKSVKSRLAALHNQNGPQVNVSRSNQRIISLQENINSLKEKIKTNSTDDKLKKQLNLLRNQLAELESNDNSVADDKEEATSATSTRTLKEDLEDRKSSLQVKIQSLDQAISDFQNKLRVLKVTYGSYASKEATLAALQKDVDLAQQEYSSAQEKYNQSLDVSSASATDKIRQTLFGQPAVRPEPSKKILIVALTMLSSFLFTILVLIVIEVLDNSLKTPYIFQQYVNLPLIGITNRLNLKNSGLQAILNNQETLSKDVTEFRDLLKKARYSIEKAGDKIFLFTSTKPGEGKSTMIIALSTLFALSRKRILILDTNFTNNSLTRYFDASPKLEGLAKNVQVDQYTFNEAIHKTSTANLDIIGCQSGLYSPSDIFPKDGLLADLRHLTSGYDYVFMEGPSLNKYSDSKELADYADSVIAVFSANSVITHSDGESTAFLSSLGTKFRGALLNNVLTENTNL